LVQVIIELDQDANIFVLGDLNDNIDSAPLQILENGDLFNLLSDVERDERYTYIYQGISQTLDHILVRTESKLQPVVITPKHFNSDFPNSFSELNNSSIRSSDHDPVYALFGYFKYPIHFPYVVSGD
jgi:predicted extracellular nuclease